MNLSFYCMVEWNASGTRGVGDAGQGSGVELASWPGWMNETWREGGVAQSEVELGAGCVRVRKGVRRGSAGPETGRVREGACG